MAASEELFVNEYRRLLSNHLLAHCSYVTDKEIRYLELFKLSFCFCFFLFIFFIL